VIKPKISEEQAGFTKGKSCLHKMFCLQQIFAKQKERNKEIRLVFVYLEMAFDMVTRKLVTCDQNNGNSTGNYCI
jgi:hypothetical protein